MPQQAEIYLAEPRGFCAGVDRAIDIVERALGDLDGFVEHLEEYEIKGRLYATNVMDAGLVKDQEIYKQAYEMANSI